MNKQQYRFQFTYIIHKWPAKYLQFTEINKLFGKDFGSILYCIVYSSVLKSVLNRPLNVTFEHGHECELRGVVMFCLLSKVIKSVI